MSKKVVMVMASVLLIVSLLFLASEKGPTFGSPNEDHSGQKYIP